MTTPKKISTNMRKILVIEKSIEELASNMNMRFEAERAAIKALRKELRTAVDEERNGRFVAFKSRDKHIQYNSDKIVEIEKALNEWKSRPWWKRLLGIGEKG